MGQSWFGYQNMMWMTIEGWSWLGYQNIIWMTVEGRSWLDYQNMIWMTVEVAVVLKLNVKCFPTEFIVELM